MNQYIRDLEVNDIPPNNKDTENYFLGHIEKINMNIFLCI